MPQYSKEQLWKIYEKLPSELKETIFSADTAEIIFDTCVNNGLEEKKIPEIAGIAGNVLLGILLPDDFQQTLEKEAKLKKDTAKKISQEITRFIFFPVKESLAMISKVEVAPQTPTIVTAPAPQPQMPTSQEEKVASKPKNGKRGSDSYRESIE